MFFFNTRDQDRAERVLIAFDKIESVNIEADNQILVGTNARTIRCESSIDDFLKAYEDALRNEIKLISGGTIEVLGKERERRILQEMKINEQDAKSSHAAN